MRKRLTHLRVTETTHKIAKSQAAIQGMTLHEWMETLVKEKEDMMKMKRREVTDLEGFKFF